MKLVVRLSLLTVGLAIASLIVLQGLEMYLRIQQSRIPSYNGATHPGIFVEHPRWGYTQLPNQAFRVRHPEFSPEVRTNALGFRGGRDDLPDLDAEAGRRRVIILGDSMMFGMSVGEEDVLANLLAASHPEVDFYNFSAPSWGTHAELEVLKDFIEPIQPSLVLVVFFENDFRNNIEPLDKFAVVKGYKFRRYCSGSEHKVPEEVLNGFIEAFFAGELSNQDAHPRIKRHCIELKSGGTQDRVGGWAKDLLARFYPRAYSHLSRQVKLDLLGGVRRMPAPLDRWLESLLANVVFVPKEDRIKQVAPEAVEATRHYLSEIRELCERYDCDVRGLVIPAKYLFHLEEDPAVTAALGAFRDVGIEVLDARPRLIERGGLELYWKMDGHPNAAGNRVLADHLLEQPWFD